jgi:transposase-like protein
VPKSSPIPGRESPPEAARQQRDRGANGASIETVPTKTRRRYSAAEKLRIVEAADAALAGGEPGAVGALLRREGIYSSHLATWRKQLRANGTNGFEARKPGRTPKLDAKDRQLLEMNKELAKLRRQLEVANAVIELQKKAHAILGIALPELDEKS